MKTTRKVAIAILLTIVIAWEGNSQTPDQLTGYDKQTIRKMNKSIKKETKRLLSLGYTPESGAPAIEFQLRHSFAKEYELDERGRNRWVIGVGSAVAGIQNAARMHAVSDANNNASMLLESRIMGLVENDYNNKLYSRDEYQTLSRMIGVFSNLLAQTLPIGVPVSTFIKDHATHYEYQVRIAYPMDVIRASAANVVADILGKENDELRKKFERITGLDKLNP